MVTARKRDALAKYTAGNTMKLRPFPNPVAPHSASMSPKRDETTPDGRSFKDLTAQRPSCFNPDAHYEDDQPLKLKIIGTISGGASHDRQILLCKTDEAPRRNPRHADIPVFGNRKQCIVAIVMDAVCYGNSVIADSDLCRRAAVLQHLHHETATGLGTINPDYYGTWVLETYDNAENYPGSKRYIGVILREYLEGESIGGLCTREEDKDGVGMLIAPTNPVIRFGTDGEVLVLDTNDQVRHEITMQLMHGIVTNEHHGVEQMLKEAEDVMVVFRRYGERLEIPQAVMLGTLYSEVCQDSDDIQQQLGKPLHPFDRFPHNEFEMLDGWYNVDWCYENRFKLDAWMLHQFGLMDEAEKQRDYVTLEDLRDDESDVTGDRNSRLKTAFEFIAKGGTLKFPNCSLPAIPMQPPRQASSTITPMFGNFRHQNMAKYLKARQDRGRPFWRTFERVMTFCPRELKKADIELRAALAWLVATVQLLPRGTNPKDQTSEEQHDVSLFDDFLEQLKRKLLKRKRDESSESDT
ncbi:hypothetical protein CGCS363_v002266 [Colletotrichum siamense]|uniref:uncharacterized protein n=1 Tax=Colletotrichum siamense TaxID=690259 RepID=UPI001872EAAE|nr:uncharacterized protein CGCS363_v002266 [Colletotrichum siamense]KAF5510044.1 hypothetical protein CGCS363_v002266 [Colletotrichum siamense]